MNCVESYSEGQNKPKITWIQWLLLHFAIGYSLIEVVKVIGEKNMGNTHAGILLSLDHKGAPPRPGQFRHALY
jgi:hypothetical protein